jgi:hypothetical protein
MVDKVDVDKVDQGSLEWIVQSFAPRVLLLKPASGTSFFFLIIAYGSRRAAEARGRRNCWLNRAGSGRNGGELPRFCYVSL